MLLFLAATARAFTLSAEAPIALPDLPVAIAVARRPEGDRLVVSSAAATDVVGLDGTSLGSFAPTTGALPYDLDGDGFDDLVLVPYVPAELYVRVRRIEWRKSEFEAGERLKLGGLCIDLAAHEVTVDGRAVELTAQEFSLLKFLAQHRGRVFSRDQLLARVWGVDYYGGSRTVDIHVRRLRMKLGSGSKPLETVRGVGYKMKAP